MASSSRLRKWQPALQASLFLAPNIIGFIGFTLIPIVFSFSMAFTNWDLTLHNSFSQEPLRFVGLENFTKLFQSPNFWHYLGNTLFLMLGIPFGIAGSLAAAVLLNSKLRGPVGGLARPLIILSLSVSLALVLLVAGLTHSAFATLITGLVGLMLIGGTTLGGTLYRTLFYLPHFTQGVAIFILWKKLYNPQTGPINQVLQPVLEGLSSLVLQLPRPVADFLYVLPLLLIAGLLVYWWRTTRHHWAEGDLGSASVLLTAGVVTGALAFLVWKLPISPARPLLLGLGALLALSVAPILRSARFRPAPAFTGFGGHLLFSLVQVTLLGAGLLLLTATTDLPAKAAAGLAPPSWLSDFTWAKPSLIVMGLWASIGGNNMILYLAGLSNISPEYYEAADIDGANNWQKFKFITWPQLAPVTFFIVVMSVIYGLQGGFEMAKTMTQGGPAGATTTLSYYIYAEGFETGRLGYASAVAWVLFFMVFSLSMVNWKFGNRYVSG